MNGYTIFCTYKIDSINTDLDIGTRNSIHSGHIQKEYLDFLSNDEITIRFNDINDFRFMNMSNFLGYQARKIYILFQIVNNAPFENYYDIKAASNEWRIVDVTNQITGYVSGGYIYPESIVETVFKVNVNDYEDYDIYDIDYLNYPEEGSTTKNITFGEENVFIGNVETEILAKAYTTDIPIKIGLNNYNYSTNPTWNGNESVYCSEVYLYDSSKKIVGTGKFNSPIKNNDKTNLTLMFSIDF